MDWMDALLGLSHNMIIYGIVGTTAAFLVIVAKDHHARTAQQEEHNAGQ